MRVRKNYINLSDDEKQLFFDAVNKLKTEGTYEKFVHMHGSPTNNVAAHMTAHFGFWHRKFLLEFENALRALPGPAENPHKFSCVTIPYWNWAHDGDVCQMLSQVRPIDDDMKVWDCTSYLGPGHWTNSSIEAPEDKDKWIVEDNLVEKLRNHLEFPVTQDPFVTVRDNGGPGDVTCSTSPFCAVDNDKVPTQFGTPACSVKKRISPVEDGWGPITCNINGSIVQRATKGFSSAGGDRAVGCVADNGGLEHESGLHSRNPYGGWLTPRIDLSDNFTCLSRATNFTIRRPDTGASGDFNTTTDVVELIASRPKFGVKWGTGNGDPSTAHWDSSAGFRLGFEMRLHVMGHGFGGGHMISYESPGDPIFWMHHSMMERVWTLWQDCHDYELEDPDARPVCNGTRPDGWCKNGAYDPYTTIETGRYWWNKDVPGFDEPAPRSKHGQAQYQYASVDSTAPYATLARTDGGGLVPDNDPKPGDRFDRGPYYMDQNHPPFDTADPRYVPDGGGKVVDSIDHSMRFTYPDPKRPTRCFLGPEFDRSANGCYECMIEVNSGCRATWKNQSNGIRGMTVIEDTCLFACGYKQCKEVCQVTHEVDDPLFPGAVKELNITHNVIDTWNPNASVKEYWDVRRLPGVWIKERDEPGDTIHVKYETDRLSEQLADTQTCNLQEDISGVKSKDPYRNPYAGTYAYRAILPYADLRTDQDAFLGYGWLVLRDDPMAKEADTRAGADKPTHFLNGTLTGGNIGALLAVDARVFQDGTITAESHVQNYSGVIGANWEYRYDLRLEKNWPNALDQDGLRYRQGLIGSVVRFHSGYTTDKVHPQGMTAFASFTKL